MGEIGAHLAPAGNRQGAEIGLAQIGGVRVRARRVAALQMGAGEVDPEKDGA
jgi:hypothetical protein